MGRELVNHAHPSSSGNLSQRRLATTSSELTGCQLVLGVTLARTQGGWLAGRQGALWSKERSKKKCCLLT